MQFYADRVSLGSHRARTPEGHLVALAVPFARTGRQVYKAEEIDKDGKLGLSGIVEVYRPREEVLSKSAISSFEGKSVTSLHPPQFLSPDNDMLYSRGHIQNVRAGVEPLPDGEWPVVGDIIIKDATLIQQIEDGHRTELSAGYNYDLQLVEDEHSPHTQFIQRNICGNHVAVVPNARGGSSLKVLDSQPEEGETMAEEVKTAVLAQPGMFAEFGAFLKTAGLRLVGIDEDPGAVERNKKKDEEALTKKSRVEDEDKMKEEEKGAKEPDKKEEMKDKKGKDGLSATDARLDRVCDLLEKVLAKDATATDKCTCDAEEGEKHKEDCPMSKKESEDADLIPIHKLHGDEIPQNPIPGADAALAKLRALRPAIAQSGDRKAIDAYNDAVRTLKAGRAEDSEEGEDRADSYGDFTNLKKPEKVVTDETRARVGLDSKTFNRSGEQAGADFEAAAAKYHRMNANEVKRQ